MKISDLIDLAKKNSGLTLGQMAQDMGVAQSRISEWKKGEHQPHAGVLAYFAEKAGLNVAETVMEVERSLDPRFAQIWERALGNLRAVTEAANQTIAPVTSSMTRTAKRVAGVVKS